MVTALAFMGRQSSRAPTAWGILERWLSRAAWWVKRGDAHGDLVVAHKEELVRDVLISASLGCHNPDIARSQAPKGRD